MADTTGTRFGNAGKSMLKNTRISAVIMLTLGIHYSVAAQEVAAPAGPETPDQLTLDADEITALIDRYYMGYATSYLMCMEHQSYTTPGVVCTNLRKPDQVDERELHKFMESYTDFKLEAEREYAINQLDFQCSQEGLDFYRNMTMEEFLNDKGRPVEAEILATVLSTTFTEMGLSMLGEESLSQLLVFNKREKHLEDNPDPLPLMLTPQPSDNSEKEDLTPYEIIKEPCDDDVLMARRIFEISNYHPLDKHDYIFNSGVEPSTPQEGFIYSLIADMQKLQSEGNSVAALELYEEGKKMYEEGLLNDRESYLFWVSSASVHFYQNNQQASLAANEKAFIHHETGSNFLVPSTLMGNYMDAGNYEKALEMALHLQEHYYSDAPNATRTNTARSLLLALTYLKLGDEDNARLYAENTPIDAEDFVQYYHEDNTIYHVSRDQLQNFYDVYSALGDDTVTEQLQALLDEWDSFNSL